MGGEWGFNGLQMGGEWVENGWRWVEVMSNSTAMKAVMYEVCLIERGRRGIATDPHLSDLLQRLIATVLNVLIAVQAVASPNK